MGYDPTTSLNHTYYTIGQAVTQMWEITVSPAFRDLIMVVFNSDVYWFPYCLYSGFNVSKMKSQQSETSEKFIQRS